MDNHRVKLKGLLLKGAEVGWAVWSLLPLPYPVPWNCRYDVWPSCNNFEIILK